VKLNDHPWCASALGQGEGENVASEVHKSTKENFFALNNDFIGPWNDMIPMGLFFSAMIFPCAFLIY